MSNTQKTGGAIPPPMAGLLAPSEPPTAVDHKARRAAILEDEDEQIQADVLTEVNMFLAKQHVFKFEPLPGVSDEYNRILDRCLILEAEDLHSRLQCLWQVGVTIKPWLARQVRAGAGTRGDLLAKLAQDLNASSKRNINITGEKLRNACRISCFTKEHLRRAVECGLNEVQCISMSSKNMTDDIRDEIIKQVEAGDILKTEVSTAAKEHIEQIPKEERVENRGGLREQKEKKLDPVGLMTKANNSLRKLVDDLDREQADAFVQMINAPEEHEEQVAKFQSALQTFGNLYQNLGQLMGVMRQAADEGFGLTI